MKDESSCDTEYVKGDGNNKKQSCFGNEDKTFLAFWNRRDEKALNSIMRVHFQGMLAINNFV